jgi:hypothetical protein
LWPFFRQVFRMTASLPKTTVYFCRLADEKKAYPELFLHNAITP